MNIKKIYILIGPKGSGKTFIGTIFKDCFNIEFIRVEDWLLNLRNGRDIEDDGYIRDSFQAIENGVRKAISKTDSLVFESLGLTEHFDKLLDDLKKDFQVIIIRISTDLKTCSQRVQNRDQSIHINISDDKVQRVNYLVSTKSIYANYTIDNNKKSVKDLETEIKGII